MKSDAARSLPHFQSAVALFPSFHEAYFNMGVADLKLLRITDAEWAFRKSIEVSGGQYAPPLFGLGGVRQDYREKFDEEKK